MGFYMTHRCGFKPYLMTIPKYAFNEGKTIASAELMHVSVQCERNESGGV